MTELIEHNKERKVRVKSEDGKLYVQTTNYDAASLDRNQDIRLSGMLEKAKLGLHDNEDIRFVISCPSVGQWQTFKKKHYDTYKLITSNVEHERMRGCRQLQILFPAWVVQERY